MKMPVSSIAARIIRPISPRAESASAGLSVATYEHAVGFSTFGLIMAMWLFTMLFI